MMNLDNSMPVSVYGYTAKPLHGFAGKTAINRLCGQTGGESLYSEAKIEQKNINIEPVATIDGKTVIGKVSLVDRPY